MEALLSLLTALNALSPLAVIALLGIVIFMLVKGKTGVAKKVEVLQNNHLHELPDMADTLRRTEETLRRIEVSMSENFAYIKARLNGHNK